MKYFVYYLYSKSLDKYYLGKTDYIVRRLAEHNRGKEKFTSTGIPWVLVGYVECSSNTEATRLERKLKKAKNKKYTKWYIQQHGKIHTDR